MTSLSSQCCQSSISPSDGTNGRNFPLIYFFLNIRNWLVLLWRPRAAGAAEGIRVDAASLEGIFPLNEKQEAALVAFRPDLGQELGEAPRPHKTSDLRG